MTSTLPPCVALTPADEATRRLAQGPLRIKFGVDPTSSNLHLGHAVALRALRALQDHGHTVQLVIGTFTAAIGDPTGRNATRPPLSPQAIDEHAQTYLDQAFLVLDRACTDVVSNRDWLGAMSAADVVRLASSATVAQMSQRDDFAKRLEANAPISLHEFLYPLFQGMDSVHLKSDAEMGGTDQTFNLMMGRDLQAQAGQRPQFVMTVPLLVGLDGVKKMSKSYGNDVGLKDSPVEKFTKIMRIPDAAVAQWGGLLTDKPEASWAEEVRMRNPRDVKRDLALSIVAWIDGPEAAQAAAQAWENAVRLRVADASLETVELPQDMTLVEALCHTALCPSKTVARQKIKEGAVRLQGVVLSDPNATLESEEDGLLQVGKKAFCKVRTPSLAASRAAPRPR